MKNLLATLVLASGLSSTAIAQQNATPDSISTNTSSITQNTQRHIADSISVYAQLWYGNPFNNYLKNITTLPGMLDVLALGYHGYIWKNEQFSIHTWVQFWSMPSQTYTWYQQWLEKCYAEYDNTQKAFTIQVWQMPSSVGYGWAYNNSNSPIYNDAMYNSPFNQWWIKYVQNIALPSTQWDKSITLTVWALSDHQWINTQSLKNTTWMVDLWFLGTNDTTTLETHIGVSLNQWSAIVCPWISLDSKWKKFVTHVTLIKNFDGSLLLFAPAAFFEGNIPTNIWDILLWVSTSVEYKDTNTGSWHSWYGEAYAKLTTTNGISIRGDLGIKAQNQTIEWQWRITASFAIGSSRHKNQ